MKMTHCPDLNQGSPVYLGQATLTAKHTAQRKNSRQWVKIILKNKHGKHNYKRKYDMKMRHCPDLNQGSPVY